MLAVCDERHHQEMEVLHDGRLSGLPDRQLHHFLDWSVGSRTSGHDQKQFAVVWRLRRHDQGAVGIQTPDHRQLELQHR